MVAPFRRRARQALGIHLFLSKIKIKTRPLTYDNASRITHLTETGLSAKTYGYDNDDRLTDFVNGATGTSYTYDADGNRTSTITAAGATTYHYPTTSNRLASLSGLTTQTESYDASGNQTGNGTTTFDFDARGRMNSSIAARVTTSYAINGFGQRVRKSGSAVPNGEVNEYVYDQQGHLIGEYNSTGGVVNETVYIGDTPVAVLTGTAGTTVYSLSADWLNSPHIIQNVSRQDVWTWDHYAFGDNVPNQNPAGIGTYAYNFRFPGQYADAESGLSYNGFRDYSPALGRYIQFDPLWSHAPGMSPYVYGAQNPLTNIDPTGLYCVTVTGQITFQDVVDNGPKFTVPTPNGYTNKSILPSDTLYHHYYKPIYAGNVDYNCLLNELIQNPTPGANNKAATEQGVVNNATPANWNAPASYVTSYLTYDSNGNPLVVNVTNSLTTHPLYPGYVARNNREQWQWHLHNRKLRRRRYRSPKF
jgi:RHS repeat-associated protein